MDNKTVVIVGVCDKRGSTNISQAKAFMRFGFNAIPINYRTLISKYGMSTFENLLLDTVSRYKPYLTLFSKTNGINPELIRKCNKHTKTVYWFMDSIEVASSASFFKEYAHNSNYVVCTGGGVANWFSEQVGKTCYHIFDGVDVDVFKPTKVFKKYKADISFIGSKTTERDYFKDVLENEELDVKFYGNGYDGEVINESFSKVCSGSKLMLSLNVFNDVPYYFSNRLLRYMGCGSCVLHLDRTKTLDKFFKHKENILFFENEDELIDNINFCLSNPKEVGRIGINARDYVLKNFTWEHCIRNILHIINNM